MRDVAEAETVKKALANAVAWGSSSALMSVVVVVPKSLQTGQANSSICKASPLLPNGVNTLLRSRTKKEVAFGSFADQRTVTHVTYPPPKRT